MKRPVYVTIPGVGCGDCCSICGCLVAVGMTDRHDSFHEALARMLGIEVDE